VKKETDMKEMMLDGVLQVGAAPCGGNVWAKNEERETEM
jgi:hypothetical protein